MSKISVVINTLNEEKNLPQALKSVKHLADELVVVDMKSDDNTVKIAKKFGAKVYDHKRMGYVEPARNFAINKATSDWILILDADEEIPSSLSKKLKELAEAGEAEYYRLPRKNMVFGKWLQHSRWWPDYNIRFFKKGFVEWSEIIHSVPTTSGRGVDLDGKEQWAILHHHYETIEQYIERLNRYTTKQLQALKDKDYKFAATDLLRKPSEEFLSRYFAGQGYKDGVHGLALAGLQAFSEFVLYLKAWQSADFKGTVSEHEVIAEFKNIQDDQNYWFADTLIKEGKGNLKNKLKRKFKLR